MAGALQHQTTALPLPSYQPLHLRKDPDTGYAARSRLTTNPVSTTSGQGPVRSEAAFAALAGTCPIPASSGNTLRHRLNRGGDRRLNRALTTVVIVRMRTHAPTKAYVARRRAEGRTTKEIMRSLKRYITRQLYRTLAAAHPAPQPLDTI